MAEQVGDSRNLTASFIAGSDMVYDFFCEVCADFDKNLEAKGFCINCSDYLCEDCVTVHGTQRTSRNHVVQIGSQMPRQKPPPSLSKSTTGSISEQCDQHPGRLTEYYCKDDGSLGCTVCMTVKHRQCRSVDHVADISEHLLDSEEYQEFTASLTSLKARSQDVIKSANDNTAQAEKLCIDVATTLQDLRKKVIEAFDKLDKDIKKKTDSIKSADVKKMKDMGDKGKEVLSEVEKISAELQTLQNKKQLSQLFVRMIKLEDRVLALHNVLDEADTDNNVTTYKFEPGTAAEEFLDSPESIGTLSVQASVITPQTSTTTLQTVDTTPQTSTTTPPGYSILRDITACQMPPEITTVAIPTPPPFLLPRNMQAVRVCGLSVKADGDEKPCSIMGSSLLPGNKLVLTDFGNFKIKLLNLQTSTVTSELKMTLSPWDVANITEDEVAVTVRDDNKIAFVKVTSVLNLEKEMSVGGRCTGIVHNNGKLIVVFCAPCKIEIIALDGSVEKRIECSNMFDWPSHMAINPGLDAVYVTDNEGQCVKKVSFGGVVEAEYRMYGALKGPRGIIVDQKGQVIVCGSGSHNIHLLSADLKKIKLLVEEHEVSAPQTLSLCHNTDKLYVGMGNDIAIVYQLSR